MSRWPSRNMHVFTCSEPDGLLELIDRLEHPRSLLRIRNVGWEFLMQCWKTAGSTVGIPVEFGPLFVRIFDVDFQDFEMERQETA